MLEITSLDLVGVCRSLSCLFWLLDGALHGVFSSVEVLCILWFSTWKVVLAIGQCGGRYGALFFCFFPPLKQRMRLWWDWIGRMLSIARDM